MLLSRLFNKTVANKRHILNGVRVRTFSSDNPFVRSWNILSDDVATFLGTKKKPPIYPEHVDIVVIGGGFIGSSTAYWLKTRTAEGLSVMVLEKDLTFKNFSDNLSLGTLTQHFSLPENIHLSKFSLEFLRNVKCHLGNDVDIQYNPCNNLLLASEKYADKMEQNVTELKEFGLNYELLSAADIRNRYPWISTHDVKLGCLGTEAEGSFNSWAFLQGLTRKSQELGTIYVNAEVVGFELEKQRDVLMEGVAPGSFERINKVIYKTPDGQEYAVKFAVCVLAAGDDSGDIARLANIGTGDGLLTIPLPVEKREYNVYSLENKAKSAGLTTPMIMDTSGLWLRRNGLEQNLLCGHIPLITKETKNLSEEEYNKNVIIPSLINRIPNLEGTELIQVTTEKHDYNTFDESGVLGPHPYHNNLYIATGFGKQGCLHSPGIGRSVAELIIDSHYTTIDLTRFEFDRLLTNQPLIDNNIY